MMMLDDERSHYDLLELTPDASPQEVRAAYLRVKAAYRKDSVALYSLISESETEDLLRRIEEAYQVLSHPDRRREYDLKHGMLGIGGAVPQGAATAAGRPNVVSIDRVPPMDSSSSGMDILVPPSTDFTQAPRPAAIAGTIQVLDTSDPQSPFTSTPFSPASQAPTAASWPSSPAGATSSAPRSEQDLGPVRPPNLRPGLASSFQHPQDAFADQAIAAEIQNEQEWRGPFLRRVREARNVPLEELSDYTKISKTYLLAIEEENWPKLPAAVYLRGFVTQMAKYLKLPHDKVAQTYVARYTAAMAERERQKRAR
jgi:curved DNA-binding protein CbpA